MMTTEDTTRTLAPTIKRFGGRIFMEVRTDECGRRLIDPTIIVQVWTNDCDKVVFQYEAYDSTGTIATIHEYDEFVPVFQRAMDEALPNDPLTAKTGDET